jgi:hypothetical protein
MKDWKCTYVNPTDTTKTVCSGKTRSKNKPKEACPICNRKNKWEEVVTAVVAPVVVVPVAGWTTPVPAALKEALDGNYATTDNNTTSDPPDGVAKTTYGSGKHWGAGPHKWEAGQYDVAEYGPTEVTGLEVKAVRCGLETEGGWVFKFSFTVGHTCMKDNNKGLPYDATGCIRVDSGATLTQGRHSHPIPESGGLETSSHEKEVKKVIIAAVNSFDEATLTAVGRYLRIINAGPKSFKFTKSELLKMTNPLPPSRYW